jgi:Pectate lyase superfamily protein
MQKTDRAAPRAKKLQTFALALAVRVCVGAIAIQLVTRAYSGDAAKPGLAHSADVRCADFNAPLPKIPTQVDAIGDEFVGPFPSWSNLKRDFGAVGDGIADDSNAVQAAFNSLSMGTGKSPILYIPAGTYRITKTVTVMSAKSIAILGEDPNKTILKWAGPSGGTLLHIDGVSYSRFNRMTFEGAKTNGVVLVDQSLSGYSQHRQFDTGNEYADDVFQNAAIGIQGGQFGLGAAETTVLRSKFINNAWGILLKNFNALDWWIWYSYFENNGSSISNLPGAGNFHAFNNIFNGSTYSDLVVLNTGNFNFRDNFSINSKKFLYEVYYYTNAAVTRLQGNTVITPPGNDCGGCSIDQGNMGPLILTDNNFVSPSDATSAAVLFRTLRPPDCVAIENNYSNSKTLDCSSRTKTQGRLISLDEHVVPASSIDQRPPILPEFQRNYHRQFFEVPANSHSAAIQGAIDKAAAQCGRRPVVHLPYGLYSIEVTVTIPANCDLQLVGDGQQTVLKWVGGGPGPALLLQGPSRAILSDFFIDAGSSTGIDVENADQQGARVYMLETQVLRSSAVNLLVDSLDFTLVELHDFQLAYTAVPPAGNGVALRVIGGPLAQQGKPQYGRTNLFAGSGGANHVTYQALHGASLLVRDAWYEGYNPSTYAQISDNSSVTLEGSRMAVPLSGDSVQLNNISCNVAILSSAPDADVNISGENNGKAWVLGNNFSLAKTYFQNDSNSISSAFNLNRYATRADGSFALDDKSRTLDPSFIRLMLAQSRTAHPTQIKDLPLGVTDLRLYRVVVELGTVGIHLRR